MQNFVTLYLIGAGLALFLAMMVLAYVKRVLKGQSETGSTALGHATYTALATSLLVVGTVSLMPLLMSFLTTPSIV